MTALERPDRKVDRRLSVFCCQPPISNADIQAIVGDGAKRNALAQLDRTSTASPIWGICKSSVCHENQPVDIREADAVVNANFPMSILSIGTTGDESMSTIRLKWENNNERIARNIDGKYDKGVRFVPPVSNSTLKVRDSGWTGMELACVDNALVR